MSYYSGLPNPAIAGMPDFIGTGKYIFVDPANGSDGNRGDGPGPSKALKTLYKGHSLATAGKNDVVVLIGDGSTTGTARLSLANAQAVDSSVTAGTLVWSKNATHLVGIASPSYFAQRARIAPPTGTYTQTTFGSGNLITVTANGCLFANLHVFHAFSTGDVNQIAFNVSGTRNVWKNCHIFGCADAASAADTGSASVKLTGGENYFTHSVLGGDTVTRTAAVATVIIAKDANGIGIPRTVFEDCIFPFMTSGSGTGALAVKAAQGDLDRWTYFIRCTFANASLSTSSTVAALATLGASMGGGLLFKDCVRVGCTDWGTDATSLAQIYVIGAASVAATAGFVGDDIGRAAVAIAS